MEEKSKEGYFNLASKHLKQAQDSMGVVQDNMGVVQDSLIEALDWLRAGAASVTDESQTIQKFKAALIESLQREEGLRARLASSEAEFRLVEKKLAESIKREKELEAKLTYSAMGELDEECKEAWRKLRESLQREKDLQRQVIFYVESERRLVAALESLLGEARKLTPNDSVEACCQNFKECNKPCVPRAEHWKWRAKESERIGREHQWYKQWRTPDVTCSAEPVKPSGSSNTSVPPTRGLTHPPPTV